MLGEFGTQPWLLTGISTAGGVVTFATGGLFPADVGDLISVVNTGTALDGVWLPVATINGGRTVVTAPYVGSVTWSGSANRLRSISPAKLTRLCGDIIASGTDVALWWMLDNDPNRPLGESIADAANADLAAVILAANTSLGW